MRSQCRWTMSHRCDGSERRHRRGPSQNQTSSEGQTADPASGGRVGRDTVVSMVVVERPALKTRAVRQVFTPILPDELVLALGERVGVVRAFDDGWCVVGREAPAQAAQQTSLFRPAEAAVDMGVVPAWVFIKPVKGLRAERPIRSTSLGITVRIDAPGFSSRDECVSWLNF